MMIIRSKSVSPHLLDQWLFGGFTTEDSVPSRAGSVGAALALTGTPAVVWGTAGFATLNGTSEFFQTAAGNAGDHDCDEESCLMVVTDFVAGDHSAGGVNHAGKLFDALGTTGYFARIDTGNALEFAVSSGAASDIQAGIGNDATRHRLVMAYEPVSYYVGQYLSIWAGFSWLDGVPKTSVAPQNSIIPASPQRFCVGAGSSVKASSYFSGQIAEVQLYRKTGRLPQNLHQLVRKLQSYRYRLTREDWT